MVGTLAVEKTALIMPLPRATSKRKSERRENLEMLILMHSAHADVLTRRESDGSEAAQPVAPQSK